jgi:hypothetical protein
MNDATLRMLNASGNAIESPREWTTGFVEVNLGNRTSDWQTATLRLNGVELALSLRRLGDMTRVVAEWPRAGPGKYRLRLSAFGAAIDRVVEIRPSKLTHGQFSQVIEELETVLPLSIALGMQRLGGLVGVALTRPREATLATELYRLQVAVRGDERTRGLIDILHGIGSSPHEMLRSTGLWVHRANARRPDPNRAHVALLRPRNAATQRQPVEVYDSRVEHTFDTYENRLVLSFFSQVERRLARLARLADGREQASLLNDASSLLDALRIAKRRAEFLDDVPHLWVPPDRVSMVLLRRPHYRSALEAFLRFHRGQSVRIDDARMDAPLEEFPHLYQLWCTLGVIDAMLSVACELGFQLVTERLIARDGAGLFFRALPDGKPAVVLLHRDRGTRVRLIPERTYGAARDSLHSLSFTQRPDIAIEVVDPAGKTAVWLFDPKYKLDGEIGTESAMPLKVDIDKMHAYRDAIRGADETRVVEFAAILYPGQTHTFRGGVEAISALPPISSDSFARLRSVLHSALA